METEIQQRKCVCNEDATFEIYMHVIGMDPNTGHMHGDPKVQVVFVLNRTAVCRCETGGEGCGSYPFRKEDVNFHYSEGDYSKDWDAAGTCHPGLYSTEEPPVDSEYDCQGELPEVDQRFKKEYPLGDFPCKPRPNSGDMWCDGWGYGEEGCKAIAEKCAQNFGQASDGQLWQCLHDQVRREEEREAAGGAAATCSLEAVYDAMMDSVDGEGIREDACEYLERNPYKLDDCRKWGDSDSSQFNTQTESVATAMGFTVVDLDSIDVNARDKAVRNKNKELASLFLNIEQYKAKTKARLDRETSYAHVNQANIYCNHVRYPTDSWYLTINYSNECMPFLDAPRPSYQKETRSWIKDDSGGDDYWIARRSVQNLDAYDENLINPQVAGEIKTWQNVNAAAPNYYAGLNEASIDKLISLIDQMPCPCSPVNQG